MADRGGGSCIDAARLPAQRRHGYGVGRSPGGDLAGCGRHGGLGEGGRLCLHGGLYGVDHGRRCQPTVDQDNDINGAAAARRQRKGAAGSGRVADADCRQRLDRPALPLLAPPHEVLHMDGREQPDALLRGQTELAQVVAHIGVDIGRVPTGGNRAVDHIARRAPAAADGGVAQDWPRRAQIHNQMSRIARHRYRRLLLCRHLSSPQTGKACAQTPAQARNTGQRIFLTEYYYA
nr:hypothetical protein [Alkalilimnicola ehrlichii]